jgi:mitogen-activated protein kinase kinase
MRPSYARLLQHGWLASLATAEINESKTVDGMFTSACIDKYATGDVEVGEWVKSALESRKSGTMKSKEKPALHAAPLDAVSSPNGDRVSPDLPTSQQTAQ